MVQLFNERQIEERLLAWYRLSTLFIADDELPDKVFINTAYYLAETGFSLVDLEVMLTNEVGPVFINNLNGKNPFPETIGFSVEEVRDMMSNYQQELNCFTSFFLKYFGTTNPLKNQELQRRWLIVKHEIEVLKKEKAL